jgi:Invasion associated locus B (IalB) protein
MLRSSRRLILAAASLAVPFGAANAEDPTLLGAFKSWTAYANGTGDSKVCYALAQPTSKSPPKVKRDPVYFLINDWPGRNAKAEPEVVPGYQYKDNSKVTVTVGAQKFTFFTKNEDGAGGAWVEQQPDEVRLIDAMKGAPTLTVAGASKRGTATRDTYSLDGLSDALDKIHSSCNL